jgi:hypothetical protein
MDETSWKLINMNIKIITECGAHGVGCWFPGDPKYCVIAIATVHAGGEKKPLRRIAKGLTDRYEQKFRLSHRQRTASGTLVITHQQCGWTNRDMVLQYLLWISKANAGKPILLLWDLFTAHRDDFVKTQAQNLGIRREFSPPGATGFCQPLNRRIFGIPRQ